MVIGQVVLVVEEVVEGKFCFVFIIWCLLVGEFVGICNVWIDMLVVCLCDLDLYL